MDHTDLATLIQEQQDDALDDGFAYEHLGERAELDDRHLSWVTPTAFMVINLKELLRALIKIYGFSGHPFLRDIGKENLERMEFVSDLGLATYFQMFKQALSCFPDGDLTPLDFV